MYKIIKNSLISTMALLFIACGDGGSGSNTVTTTSATLVSIAVTPNTPSIAKGLTQQLTAMGTYTDGSTVDITSSATWTSANTSASTVTSSGLVTAVDVGDSIVTATKDSISGTATVTTVNSAPVGQNITYNANGGFAVTIDLNNYFSDADGDPMTGTVVGSGILRGTIGQGWWSATISGMSARIEVDTNTAYEGDAYMDFTVTDGTSTSAVYRFTCTNLQGSYY